jgi:hypothetical protein
LRVRSGWRTPSSGSACPAEEPDEHAKRVERHAAAILIRDNHSPVDINRLSGRRIQRQPL